MSRVSCIAIDDDPLFLKQLEAYIEGIEWLQFIEGFTNPVQAATVILRENPDLILLDLEMPHIDGYGLVDWVMPKLLEMQNVPLVVVVSGVPEMIDPGHEGIALHIRKDQIREPKDLDKLLSPLKIHF